MSALREAQLRMAAHLRDPSKYPAPEGVEERRLQIYRDLIYNNIENFICSGFPVLHSLYQPAEWTRLVRAFMDSHRCRTPLFPEIGQEFLQFLMEEYQAGDCDPPFMQELAHYEWVELALDIAEGEVPAAGDCGDILQAVFRLSPLAWVLAYQYPVHRVGPAYRPSEPQPTWLAVYRDRADNVQFMELTAATARLLHCLNDNTAHTRDVLDGLAGELGMAPAALDQYARNLLRQMLGAGLVFVYSGD